jgi:ankyrin repeat protein
MTPLALCAAAVLVLGGCGQGGGTGSGGNGGGSNDGGSTTPSTAPAESSRLDTTGGPTISLASNRTNVPVTTDDEANPAGPTVAARPMPEDDTGSKSEKKKEKKDPGNTGSAGGTGSAGKGSGEEKKDDPGAGKKKPPPSLGPTRGAGASGSTAGRSGSANPMGNRGGKVKTPVQPEYEGDPIIVVEPTALDLGDIPTNDAKTGTVMLKNTGDEPRTLINCKTNCGCTAANCQRGKTIKPGEEMEVEIRLSGGSVPRTLSKTVTFLISDQAPIQLPVRGEAISFVTIEPAILDPEKHPDGKIVLTAIDDEPFTIRSMYPPVYEEFSTEPKVTHEIYMPWDKWRELGQQRKLLFTLDHPRSGKVYGTIAASAVDRTKGRNTPPRAPQARNADRSTPATKTSPDREFDRLLKQGESAKVIELVNGGELEIDQPDRTGQTPLIRAARAGDVEVVQALIDASADITVSDRVGRSPLMYAAQSKNAETVHVLLDAGADVSRRDNLGNTTLSWASGFGDAETVQVLIDAGARVDVVGAMTGFTPLIWAAGFGDPESIPILVEAGADLEAPDALQGATPLMHAVRTGGADNVRALLEAGADLEARDNQGKTPLLVAAANSGADAKVIQMLIDAGADLSATDRAGHNALDLARKRTDMRAQEVERLLATKIEGGAPEAAGASAGK